MNAFLRKQNACVLIVEDDPDTAILLSQALRREGLSTLTTDTAEDAIRIAADHSPELIIMDWNLARGDGIGAVTRIREFSSVPVMMLTARDSVRDKVHALDRGADDYLVKPFAMEEFTARVLAHLRRQASAAAGPRVLRFPAHSLEIDLDRARCEIDGNHVDLSPKEFRVLATLAGKPDEIHPRDSLQRELFPADSDATPRASAIDTLISRLRAKIEPDRTNPRIIVTVHRVGYTFRSN